MRQIADNDETLLNQGPGRKQPKQRKSAERRPQDNCNIHGLAVEVVGNATGHCTADTTTIVAQNRGPVPRKKETTRNT